MKKVLIQNELIVQHNGLSGPICAMGLNYFFLRNLIPTQLLFHGIFMKSSYNT